MKQILHIFLSFGVVSAMEHENISRARTQYPLGPFFHCSYKLVEGSITCHTQNFGYNFQRPLVPDDMQVENTLKTLDIIKSQRDDASASNITRSLAIFYFYKLCKYPDYQCQTTSPLKLLQSYKLLDDKNKVPQEIIDAFTRTNSLEKINNLLRK